VSKRSIPPSKLCRTCGQTKPRSDFYPRLSNGPNGLSNRCKVCDGEYQSRYRAKNPERIKERRRKYYQANREQILERNRKWVSENPDKVLQIKRDYAERRPEVARESQRRYVQRNRELVKASARAWWWANRESQLEAVRRRRKENPAIARHYKLERRAREQSAVGSFDPADVLAMHSDQGGLCAYCEVELNGAFHVDHMIPLSRGGSNWPDNLAITCVSCNSSKGAKTAEEFWRYMTA
jgi:5-methylcytosine-specific restriction endonuclease McrA